MTLVLSILKHVFSFTIPVPVALLVILWGVWQAAAYFDKTAAIEAAIKELVAGAEIEAANARTLAAEKRAAAAKDLLKATQTQLEAEKRALAEFQAAAQETEQELKDQIDDALSTPAPDRCIAPDEFINKLRNK